MKDTFIFGTPDDKLHQVALAKTLSMYTTWK